MNNPPRDSEQRRGKCRAGRVHPRYLRMMRGMSLAGEKSWSVYMLRCGDDTLYTGVAKDVAHRLQKHRAGKGSAYTRSHLPVALVYEKSGFSRSQALVEEARLKRLPRTKKMEIFDGGTRRPPRSRISGASNAGAAAGRGRRHPKIAGGPFRRRRGS